METVNYVVVLQNSQPKAARGKCDLVAEQVEVDRSWQYHSLTGCERGKKPKNKNNMPSRSQNVRVLNKPLLYSIVNTVQQCAYGLYIIYFCQYTRFTQSLAHVHPVNQY